MHLEPIAASEKFAIVDLWDGRADSASIRFASPELPPRPELTPEEVERSGAIRATDGDDGELLLSLSYPEAHAACRFIEAGQPGQVYFGTVVIVRDRDTLDLAIRPLGASVGKHTVLDPQKALLVAAALRICSTHHLFPHAD